MGGGGVDMEQLFTEAELRVASLQQSNPESGSTAVVEI